MAAAVAAAGARTAAADAAIVYGEYELLSLSKALARLGLEIEPRPEGKRLRQIHVVNEDVFSHEDGILRRFNLFHRTTRDYMTRREVVLEPGEVWNQTKIMQTVRRLRNPSFTTLAVVAPVRTPDMCCVDMLVVTRDVWSFRLNSNFEVQQKQLTQLTISLSENNVLGWRKQFAGVFDMDQGKYSIGPLYIDKNIAGTRLELRTRAGAVFGRASNELEGSHSFTDLTYPLWSVDQTWGGQMRLQHADAVVRVFRGTSLLTYDAPETAHDDALPYEYRHRVVELESSVVHSQGDDPLHRFSLGHQLRISRPSLLATFPGSGRARDSYIRDVLPRWERTSTPFVRYELYPPRFVTYHNVASYDLSEDAQLGTQAAVELGSALKLLGSENNHVRLSLSAIHMQDLLGDGFLRAAGEVTSRLQAGELVDNFVEASVKLAAPRVARFFRLVAQAEAGQRINEKGGRFVTAGGQAGLRGYPIGAFVGQTKVVANLELRTMAMQILFARLGAVLFYDVGHAARSAADLHLHHDAGFGLRLLLPQLSPLVHRLDWAIPFNGPGAGLPGRFTLGLAQVF